MAYPDGYPIVGPISSGIPPHGAPPMPVAPVDDTLPAGQQGTPSGLHRSIAAGVSGIPDYTPITAPMVSPAGQAALANRQAMPAPTRPVARRGGGPAPVPDMYAGVPAHLKPGHGGFHYPDPSTYHDRVNKWAAEVKVEPATPYDDMSTEGLEKKQAKDAADLAEGERRVGVAQKLKQRFDDFQNTAYGIGEQRFALQGQMAQDKLASAGRMVDAERVANQEAGWLEELGQKRDAEMAADQAKARAEHQDDLENRQAEIDMLSNEVSNTKVDPGRFWHKAGIGKSLLAVLGVALGGFAHGYSGGRLKNTALEQLNRVIDRDVAAQQHDIANRRAGIKTKRTLYAMARERFGDEEQAAMFARGEMWKHVARYQRRVARGLTDKRKAEQAEQIALYADNQAQDNALAVKGRAATLAAQAAQMKQQAMMAGAHARAAAKQRAAMGGWTPASRNEHARFIPGWGVLQPGTKGSMKEIRKQAGMYETLRSDSARLQQLMSSKANMLDPNKRREARQIWGRIKVPAYKKYAGAATSPQEEDRINAMLGVKDPASISEDMFSSSSKAVGRYVNGARVGLANQMRSHGFSPADGTFQKDPRTGKRKFYVKYHNTGQVYRSHQGRSPVKAGVAR